MHDTNLYELICIETDIIEHKQVDLTTLVNQMIISTRHNSVRGEILSAKGCVVAKRVDEISKIEQVFLDSCAFHYHGVKDYSSMIKIFRAFNISLYANQLIQVCTVHDK